MSRYLRPLGIARVAPVRLLFALLPAQIDLVRVDDHDEVAQIEMRRVLGAVFSPEDARHLRGRSGPGVCCPRRRGTTRRTYQPFLRYAFSFAGPFCFFPKDRIYIAVRTTPSQGEKAAKTATAWANTRKLWEISPAPPAGGRRPAYSGRLRPAGICPSNSLWR